MIAWEAIRRFISEKSRNLRQRRQPIVVEEDGSSHAPINSDVPLQFAGPQFEEPSGLPARGKVKWFSPNKSYGFVKLSDGTGDAFLHATVLGRFGLSSVQRGETLELRVAQGQRGPQVTEVISVDSSTAAPTAPRRSPYPAGNRMPSPSLESSVEA